MKYSKNKKQQAAIAINKKKKKSGGEIKGKQKNLPQHLKEAILKAGGKFYANRK